MNGTTTVICKQRILETDPNTSVAWTLAGVDAVQGGAVENNDIAYRCTSVLMMVAYVPGAAASTAHNLSLLGAGA